MSSSLNIGVRHLLPTFPFIYILVGGGIISLLKARGNILIKSVQYLIVIILILWQIISIIKIYPHFLAYFNGIVGGPDNGYIYAVDSNLDWGQDLKRLKKWTDEQEIDAIHIDYFGGGDPEYYLENKFKRWWGTRNPKELPRGSYLAVSATLLQGGRGKPVAGFDKPSDYYLWLNQYEPPVAKIGHSIFVYYIE